MQLLSSRQLLTCLKTEQDGTILLIWWRPVSYLIFLNVINLLTFFLTIFIIVITLVVYTMWLVGIYKTKTKIMMPAIVWSIISIVLGFIKLGLALGGLRSKEVGTKDKEIENEIKISIGAIIAITVIIALLIAGMFNSKTNIISFYIIPSINCVYL